MFIEKGLKQEYKRKAGTLQAPEEVEQHVFQHIQDLNGQKNRQGKVAAFLAKFSLLQRMPRTAVIAVVLVLLVGFGFGVTQLFSMEMDHALFEVEYDKRFTLVHTSSEEIMSQLKSVQSQLEPGEAAIVYLPELEKEAFPHFREYPFMKVGNPILYQDLNQWSEILGSPYNLVKQPNYLPEDFTLQGGVLDLEYWGALSWEGMQLGEELVQSAQGNMEWVRYTEPEYTPTFVYEDASKNKIFVSPFYVGEEVMKMIMTVNSFTDYEQVNIRGDEGFYTNNSDHILYEGDVQGLSWFEKIGESVFQYSILTNSPDVTKEDLIKMAESVR
ncbi:hypothetical protein [Bacillus horti]|uniref:DUF4367 domain-containing protein n=1 Tax=Caldalkalibacillus horti TaxID=77523 RepID=A0ABT9VZK1_9BACI|nr:hypothetical protein [Bacillus horti]MDQ0166280.1 hypothetical protein [Bacillus horti]